MNTYYPLTRGFTITSPFGQRGNEFHWGTDFGRAGGSGGNPVHAVRRGKVTHAGPATGFGRWVVVDSPDGGTHVYGHVQPEVVVGQYVNAGQRIAFINPDRNTNGDVDPHLHLEWHRYVWVPPGPNRLNPWVELQNANAIHPAEGTPMQRLGLDYAGGVPRSEKIREAGYTFVVRYLTSGGASLPGKLLTRREADAHRANGVDIVANYESWADRMLDGYAAGRIDAAKGQDTINACGGGDEDIYFSADWDATEAQQAAINEYLDGAASLIGRERVGIYGGYWPVKRALDAGKASKAWQTGAWSGGRVDPRINIFQRIGFVNVDGVQCDENVAMTEDFGQWGQEGNDMPANWLKDQIPTQYVVENGAIRLAGPGDENHPGRIRLEVWDLLSRLDGRIARTEANVERILAKLNEIEERHP